MRHRLEALVRATLRSLPLAILLATAASVTVIPFLRWFGIWIFGVVPMPARAVWLEYLAIKAVAGACVGVGVYAVGRLPDGWVRTCLFGILYFVLLEGDPEDLARWPLDHWLSIWLAGALIMGVIFGTVVHMLVRRHRARQAAARQPDTAL
jgi:hypothetical protein